MPERIIKLSTTVTLDVPPKDLWEFLADTDRLNRSIGLPSIFFTPLPDPDRKGYHSARTKYFGINFEYEEQPFEWAKEQFYEVVRVFKIGVVRNITAGIRMKPAGAGTELNFYAEIHANGIPGNILARTVLKKRAVGDLLRITKQFEKKFREDSGNLKAPVGIKYEINETQLAARLAIMKESGISGQLIGRLKRHLEVRSDLEVISMRPFDLANQWGEDKYGVLKLFLYAAKFGVLDLHWTILCPNCNGINSDTLTLSQLKKESHCDTCMIQYGSDLASSVEARFSVNPSIRIARRDIYCIGGPANMPQIIAQFRLAPGSTRSVRLDLASGTVRIRSFQISDIREITIENRNAGLPATLKIVCDSKSISVDAEQLQSGPVETTIINATKHEVLLIVETETWKERAATAAMVISLQDFKDLFPQEAIAPGEEISMSSIAVLFTDLKGSTSLYNTVGDVPAFNFVQSHFRYLTEFIARHHGGLYKTMGDAVMASFSKSSDAVHAAIEMQNEWSRFIREYGNHSNVKLKIGIHEGSAIAINNKGRMDCFGSTINIAAHTQRLSTGGDIVLSSEVYNDIQVKELLNHNGSTLKTENFRAHLKGYPDEQFEFWRVVG